ANVGIKGCKPGGPKSFFGACSNKPAPETCDGKDNDCNGIVDDGVPRTACDVPGKPGLDYGPNSQCKQGTQICGTSKCVVFVGPSAEICDGIDNDCNGVVDDNVPGVGADCGSALPPCVKGKTACVGGAIVCQGGAQPKPETCNGIDDDCN